MGASIPALRIVIDTSVFVSALLSHEGASREIIRRCLLGEHDPLMSDKLFCEFEDALHRPELTSRCPLSKSEREELLDAFVARTELIPIFFLWRPNLPDEGDNHLIELAVAGAAEVIVTHNVRDFRAGELKFGFEIQTPREFLRRSD